MELITDVRDLEGKTIARIAMVSRVFMIHST